MRYRAQKVFAANLADHFAGAHAPGLERGAMASQGYGNHARLDNEQVIADLPRFKDRLAGTEGLQGHVLAEGVFLFLTQGRKYWRTVEQRPWPRQVGRRSTFIARQQIDPGRLQVPIGQVEQLIAHHALLAHRGDETADLVFRAAAAGAFQRHTWRWCIEQLTTALHRPLQRIDH